jgi:hypothetical protein
MLRGFDAVAALVVVPSLATALAACHATDGDVVGGPVLTISP